MKKVLLTSAGFENPAVKTEFLLLAGKEPSQIRALWVPTAAVDAGARAVLAKCMQDLFGAGIPADHIMVYNLEEAMPLDELCGFDAVYFCGGSPEHLMKRIRRAKFAGPLRQFIASGGVYVGVSAGSIIAAGNLRKGLKLVDCVLHVHCENGELPGAIDLAPRRQIRLANRQALLLTERHAEVIE